MKNWKLIKNYNSSDEEIKFFDRFSKKILDYMLENENYILLSYNSFVGAYIYIDDKLDKNNKKVVLTDKRIYY